MTTGVAAGIGIDAYPGHSARAAQVTIADATPVPLDDGWPKPAPTAVGPPVPEPLASVEQDDTRRTS
jgi:hypothetical protein